MGPAEFIGDPRFRAMRAVQTRSVYRYPRGFTVNMFGIIETPLAAHWLAEIAHPDLLPWRTRELVRRRIRDDLEIALIEYQLDRMLSVEENRGMPHAERFEKAASPAAERQ